MLKKFLCILIVVIIALSGCSQEEKADKVEEISAARLVKTTAIYQGDVMEYLNYSGILEAEQAINITPAIGGEIKEIYVKEGDFVEKGFLLARLDDTELQQAKLQYEMLGKNFQKVTNLYQSGSIDEGSYDEASAGFNSAKKTYEFLQENTEIKAPYSGVITAIALKENEIFNNMAMPYLMRLVNLSQIKGTVYLSEVDLGKLVVGNEVYFTTDTSADKEYRGEITFISPEADPYSGTYLCQFTTSNPKNVLKHNQFCRIKLITAKSVGTMSVPPTAVIENKRVMINDSGKAKSVTVKTGLENEFEVEIVNGLRGDEEIIYVGNLGLEEGNKLQVNK